MAACKKRKGQKREIEVERKEREKREREKYSLSRPGKIQITHYVTTLVSPALA
jgi:hypothetical protein